MPFAIGIAAGHQFTDAVAIKDSEIVAFVDMKNSLNFHNEDQHDIRPRLRKLLDDISAKIGVDRGRLLGSSENRFVLSLPGVSTPMDRESGLSWFRAIGCDENKVQVVDDTWAGVVSGLLKDQGICAFAGAGATVFFAHEGFRLGKPWKLDGYGAVIGDFGSGFEIGLQLIRQICRYRDTDGIHPLYAEACKMEPNLEGLEGENRIQEWFTLYSQEVNTGEWRKRVFRLAEVVINAAEAENPEPIAVKLVQSAAREISETISTGLRRFGDAVKDYEITCHGGIFRYSKIYRDEVRRIITEEFPHQTIRLGAYHPVVGAGLMARAAMDAPLPGRSFETPPKALPDKEVTQAILESVFTLDLENVRLESESPKDQKTLLSKLCIRANPNDLYGRTTPDDSESVDH